MGVGNSSGKVPATEPNVVLLHAGCKRGPYAPHMSMYVNKLECYLRIAKIPFQFTGNGGMGPKGKIPWIQLNGEKMGDSYFIMQHLNEKFNVNLNKNLTDEQQAAATSFAIMIEEFLESTFTMEWILYNDGRYLSNIAGVPMIGIFLYKTKTRKDTKAQGIGRHTEEEVHHLVDKQLNALSKYLGDKDYMMGKEATEVDCSVFACLATMLYHMDSQHYHHKVINDKYKNLVTYMERIKTTYYPDWETICDGIPINKSATEVEPPHYHQG